MAPHSSIPSGIIPWTEEPGGYSPWGHKQLDTTELLSTTQYIYFSFFFLEYNVTNS